MHRPLTAGAGHSVTPDALRAANLTLPERSLQSELNARLEQSQLSRLRRAGPHILRSIRATGSRRVRDWLQRFAHPSLLKGDRAGYLWETAWCVDATLSKASSAAVERALVEEDVTVEMQLRTLAAAELMARGTIDSTGAQYGPKGYTLSSQDKLELWNLSL